MMPQTEGRECIRGPRDLRRRGGGLGLRGEPRRDFPVQAVELGEQSARGGCVLRALGGRRGRRRGRLHVLLVARRGRRRVDEALQHGRVHPPKEGRRLLHEEGRRELLGHGLKDTVAGFLLLLGAVCHVREVVLHDAREDEGEDEVEEQDARVGADERHDDRHVGDGLVAVQAAHERELEGKPARGHREEHAIADGEEHPLAVLPGLAGDQDPDAQEPRRDEGYGEEAEQDPGGPEGGCPGEVVEAVDARSDEHHKHVQRVDGRARALGRARRLRGGYLLLHEVQHEAP
mmetsp:Transcript_17471/g.58543  ORF Transcript_17471/g.58543 Transcript_17471/m.58543 type:complete len:289 (-) Transcript_17471:450-1316(-)